MIASARGHRFHTALSCKGMPLSCLVNKSKQVLADSTVVKWLGKLRAKLVQQLWGRGGCFVSVVHVACLLCPRAEYGHTDAVVRGAPLVWWAPWWCLRDGKSLHPAL